MKPPETTPIRALSLTETAHALDTDPRPPQVDGTRVLLGRDEPSWNYWWHPAITGPLEVISAPGTGRTSMARAITAQLLRPGSRADTVTVIGDPTEWVDLAACPALRLIDTHDPVAIAHTMMDLAERIRAGGRSPDHVGRFLVVDDLAPITQTVRGHLKLERHIEFLSDLDTVLHTGWHEGVHTVATDATDATGIWPAEIPARAFRGLLTNQTTSPPQRRNEWMDLPSVPKAPGWWRSNLCRSPFIAPDASPGRALQRFLTPTSPSTAKDDTTSC